jgi:hypothetical protein
MKHLYNAFTFAAIFFFTFSQHAVSQNLVTYAGNSGKERFNDVVELSNGKVLVAAEADNLAWVPGGTPITTLTVNLAPGISSINSSDSRVAFLMLLNSTQSTIEQVVRFPAGTVASVNRIRTTNQIGSATADMYISGMRTTTSNSEDGYFIARLNNNFVGGVPTACSWYFPVSAKNKGAGASAYKTIQPWDCGNDGSVVFGTGLEYDWDWAAIQKLDASGNLTTVENWPYHTDTVGINTEQNYKAASAYSPGSATYSSIVLKAYRSGSLRSSVNGTAFWNGYNFNGLDENNNPRKGKFPDDFFAPEAEGATPGDGRAYGRLTQGTNYNTSTVGYRTNFRSTRPTGRLGGIVIDRRDNHMYFGYSTQTAFWSVTRVNGSNWVPDFEPVVVAMNNTGGLKWWARLYNQRDISLPDQYIDAVDIDYASDQLVVLARQHGFSGNMFWKGNQLFFNGGASGFKNSNSGVNTIETGHYTWIGKYDLIRVPSGPIPVQPKLLNATFVAEYSDNPTGLGSRSNDPKLDNWFLPNSGFPDLNTTKGQTRMNVSRNGSVAIVATGRRTITTADAHQKMPKPGTGSVSSWNQFIRVYRPDLSSPVYSSLLTGAWDTLTGVGGSNTEIFTAFPFSNGVYVAGYHQIDPASGTARPNNITTANVPTWGNSAPNSESAIFGRLGFTNLSPIALSLTQNTFCSASGSNTATINFTPPPNFLVTFNPGNQFQAELSDINGKFAEDGGTTTVLGSLTSTSNAAQSLTATFPIATPAGTGYGIRVRATNPVTPGFWYGASIVTAAPGTPGPISGPTQVCSNASTVTPFIINKVANATTYQWEVSPTVSNQLDPCDLPTCAGKISGTDTAGSVVWNPSYSGTATVRVRAVNACGTSAWQTFSVTNISPCITNTGEYNGCAGGTFAVNFTVPTGVTVAGTNQFTAELSDVSGNFPGTIIGTATNVAGGAGPLSRSISATIPGGQAAGANYRIRVNGVSGTTPAVSSLVSSSLSNIRNIPSVPGTPTGTSTFLCVSQISGTYTYSVAAASGATDYEWRIVPDSAGTVVSGTDINATISWNQFVGTPQLQVRAKNSCGNSAWSTALTVTISGCNTITGTTPAGPFCPGQSGITVQLSTPAGQNYSATNTFTVEILDGSGTNLAPPTLGSTTLLSNSSPTFVALTGSTASFSLPALTPGNYSFRLRSVSGSGGGTKLGPLFPFTVTGSSPAQPGNITGSTTPTCGQTGVSYSISAVSGATSYNWSIAPSSAGTISGSGTSITINFAATYVAATATLFVSATNACGTSSPQGLAITLGCAAPTGQVISPPATGNFRTRQSGSWFTPNTWETWNGSAWVIPASHPTSASGVLNILNGHNVNVHWPVNVSATNRPTTGNINAVTVSSGNTINAAVVGDGGTAWRTLDGSSSWTTVNTGTSQKLNSLNTFTTGRYVIAVGNSGTIIRGDGGGSNAVGGSTWNASFTLNANGNTSPITENLNWVDLNAGDGLIVGDNGRVIVSTALGATLDNRSSVVGTSNNLRGTLITANGGSRQAHIIGANGYYRSTTMATWSTNPTWNTAQTLSGSPQLNGIAVKGNSFTVLAIVGNGGVIFRSTDAGVTWTSVSSPTTNNLLSIRWAPGNSPSEVFAVGENGTFLLSRNDAQTWEIVNVGTTQTLNCVFTGVGSDQNHGYAVGNAGTLIAGVNAAGTGISVDQVVIDNGGTLRVCFKDFNWNNGSGVDLDVAGTYELMESSYATEWPNGAGVCDIVFRPTGIYRHGRNGGTASRDLLGRFQTPAPIAVWMPGSLAEIYGVTSTSPNLRSQTFSNFTWNCANQTTALTLSNLPTAITGTFRVQSTGTQSINLSGASTTFALNYPTITLDGGTLSLINTNSSTNRATLNLTNLNVNGGTFTPMADQGLATFNISGQFNQTGGTINSAAASSTLKGAIFNIGGNFLQSGGTFTQTLATSAFGFTQSPIIFMGIGTQNISIAGTIAGNLDFQINKPGGILNVTGNSSIGTIGLRWIAGNINTNGFSFSSGPLSLRGAANTTFATLSGTGGMNTNALSIVSGRLDNTADNLIITNPSSFTAITGGDRNSWVIGSLRKVFGPSVSGSMTFPIGTSTAFKPMAINGFTNDGTQKTLSFSVAPSGASQASGTKIQNVGTQILIGGVNWRIRRTDAPTGSISALSSVRFVNDTLTSNQRIGQTNTNLTSGFASLGGNVARNASLSVATARYYDFTTTKPIDISTLSSSNGTWFAIGGPSTVTPPGGGYTVGPTGNFPNLTSVAAEYNDVKFTSGTSFNFQSSYEGRAENGGTEVFPITFKENQAVSVSINYTGSSIVETSNSGIPNTNPILVLDGADNISFNGNDKWRFLNKGTGNNANAVRLQNGAQNNSFKDLILEGSDENSGFTGTVFLGSGTTVGNSNNTFESCRISSNADRRLEPIVIGISNNFMPGLGYGAVINASNTTPITITTPMNHGFSTGQDVLIEGVHGNYAANGTWQITVTGPKTFTLDGSVGNGNFRVSYRVNTMTATNPVTVRTADQLGNIIDHNIPIGQIQPMGSPGFSGTSLTYTGLASNGIYYAKAISSDELELYSNAAATTPLVLTGGTYTPGTGTIRFVTDSRLYKPQAGPPVLNTLWKEFGNGSIFIWITNVSKLGSGLIEITTSASHNMISGWAIRMADVDASGGNMEEQLNRWAGWQVDVTAPDKFTLRNSNGANGGVDVTGSYISGGRFLVSPVVVSSNNHGLNSGNPVSINGVQGVYMANGTHYVRKLDNNAFSIWENVGGADSTKPRYLSFPGVNSLGNSPGVLLNGDGYTGTATFSRPGLPFYTSRSITNFTYLNNTPVAGQVTFFYTCPAGTFGSLAIGQRFYVVVSGVGGIGGTSPNQEWQGSNAFGIVTATNQFTVTINGSSSGSYTSGGTFNNTFSIESIIPTKYGCNSTILDTWETSGCGGEFSFQPELVFGKNSGLRVGDEFTISGVAGPVPNHPYNGTFRALTAGYQGNGGSTSFSSLIVPTTAPIINTGGVPNMTADPNPPFNGQVVAAYDILATRHILSQNTGNSLNAGNIIKDNEISQFDEVAISITSLGNGGNWQISGNSIFNKFSQPPAVGASNFQGINFVPGLKSNNNLISGNFIGGQEAATEGNAMVFSRGVIFECFNVNVGNEVATQVYGNVIRNINTTSFSGSQGGISGFTLSGGRIDVKNNLVGGYDTGTPQDTIRTNSSGIGPPVCYGFRNLSTDSVSMVGNAVAHMAFPPVTCFGFSHEGNGKALLKGNTVKNISAGYGFNGDVFYAFRIGNSTRSTGYSTSNATVNIGNHGLQNGDFVWSRSNSGNSAADGMFRVTTPITTNSFTLQGYVGSGSSSNSGDLIMLPRRLSMSFILDSNQVQNLNLFSGRPDGMLTQLVGFGIFCSDYKGIITRNRYFNNRSISSSALAVFGQTTNDLLIANNQLTQSNPNLSQGGWNNANSHSILIHIPGLSPYNLPRVYFNTVWQRNHSANTNQQMFGFLKGGPGRALVRNNIFFTSSSLRPNGPAYSVGVTNTSGWSGSDFTNNLLYSEGANAFLAQWTTTSISTIPNWQGFAGAGSVDNIFNYANFEEVQPSANGNLKLSSDNCPIKDKGINVAYRADYDSLQVRDVSKPDLGSNEFSRFLPRGAFWTGAVNNDWNTDANWCDQRVPLADEDVTITNAPAKPFMPIISTADAVCRNLNVANNSGSMLVIYGENAALTVSGKTPQIRFAHDNLSNITGSVRFITDSVQNIPGSAAELNFPGRNVLRSRPRIISLTFTTNPDVITINATGHGLALGDQVLLANVRGATVPAKPLKVIQIIDANNFRLSGLASGTYTANSGTIIPLAMIPINAMSNGPTAITITTPRNHNLQVGQMVAISGARGNVRANGSFEVATTPTATTFTINVVSADAFVFDTSAYAFPGRTGYFDVVVDGNSQKEASGIIEARTLTVAGGDLNLPFGQVDLTNTLIRDSLIISGNRTVNLTGSNYRFGHLINKGGTVSFPTANVQVNDSLTTRGGTLSISAGTITTRNLAVLGGGALNLGSGNVTVSDSLMVFGGSVNKTAGNVDVGRRLNLRSGNVVLGTGGTLTITNPAGSIVGGSANSYVDGILAQAVNSVGGQVGTATSITAVANTTPIRITRNTHGLLTGDRIRITGSSPSGVNGLWNVIRIDANNFDLVGTTALGAGSGGTFTRFGFGIQGGTSSGTPIVVTSTAHGLTNGDVVRVMNNTSNPRANGVWTVANVTANTFELSGTIGDGSSTSGANVGTVVRLETRNFPIGKGANYRPTSLHLAQGFTTAKLYTAEYKEAAPQTLNMPVDQPVYGAPGLEAVSTLALSSFHTISQSAPAQAIDAGSVTLSYGTTEGVTLHNRRGLTIVKDSVPHDTWLHLYATSIDSTSATRLVRSTRNFTTFSDFTLGFLLDVPLGLDLVDFQARLVKNAVSCRWTTVNERDMQSLVLERSVDGKHFSLLSTHEPKGGQNLRAQYAHLDEQALQLGVGKLYYRLRITETTGRVSYSPVRVVDLNAGALENMAVYPLPFQKEVFVDLSLRAGEEVELEVSDVLGRKVWNRSIMWNAETASQSLDLSALPSGTYVLKVKTDSGAQVKKLVKE